MDRQMLCQFRWVVLLGGATLFLGMAYFVVPFHCPGPLAVLIGTGIVATRGFRANRYLRISGQAMTGFGIGEWLRSRDGSSLVYCAVVGGFTAIALYCMSGVVARVTAPIMAGLGHYPL